MKEDSKTRLIFASTNIDWFERLKTTEKKNDSKRNTVGVSSGGWVAIRFLAYNPVDHAAKDFSALTTRYNDKNTVLTNGPNQSCNG